MSAYNVDKRCRRRKRDILFSFYTNLYEGKSPQSPFTTDVQWKAMFKHFDNDCDGRLRREELTEAFRQLGSHFPAIHAFRALHHADANGDGFISEDELEALVEYVKNHRRSFDI